MSKENRELWAGLGAALLLPFLMGAVLGWSNWITVPMFLVVLAGTYRKLMYGTRTAADHVGALLDKIGLYSGNPVRDLTAHRVAQAIDAAGNPGVAGEVRRRYDTLDPADFPKAYSRS